MIPTFCTSPFPYCQSIPHIGNTSAALKADITCKLREAFFENQLTEQKTFFPYSFHLTGLPIFQKLSYYKEQLKQKSLKQVINENNLNQLEKYISEEGQLTEPQKWYKLMVKYYTDLFCDLNIKTTLPCTHTTTQIDPQYSKFVRYLFEKLNQKNLIIEKDHFLVVCDKCANVLGDHDRTAKQGLGIVYVDCNRYTKDSQVYFDHCTIKSKIFYKNGPFFIGKALQKQIYRSPASKWYAHLDNKVLLVEESNETKEIDFETLKVECIQKYTIPTLETGIRCRCTGEGTIKPLRTLFVKFSDPDWKAKVTAFINKSKNIDVVKKSLLAQSQALRDLAFLRTRGYGTTLEFLKDTVYEKDYVESLLDSTLHNYYYGILYDTTQVDTTSDGSGVQDVTKPLYSLKRRLSLSPKDYDKAISSYRYVMHATGRDLIATHCLYHYYFASLFFPQIEPTTFDCSKYIVVGNQKMSKSIGNVLCWPDLQKEGIKPSDLRAFFSMSADTINPLETSLTEIKNSGFQMRSRISTFKKAIKENTLIDSSILFWIYILALRLDLKPQNFKQSLKEMQKFTQEKVTLYETQKNYPISISIKNYIRALQKPDLFKVFGCREYYYLIFSQIYNCVKDIKQPIALDEKLKNFLRCLIQIYEDPIRKTETERSS